DTAEVVFTGSMDWMPNEDAMVHFVERILPRIAAAVPGVKMTIVGRNPSRRVLELAAAGSTVNVTGRVDDVRPYLDRAAVCVVPLRIGGGTRLKIFEAMAMGKPVVATTVGAEGLPVRPGRELLIADEPESFAASVVSLLQNPRAAKLLGLSARTFVRDGFRWESVADSFI